MTDHGLGGLEVDHKFEPTRCRLPMLSRTRWRACAQTCAKLRPSVAQEASTRAPWPGPDCFKGFRHLKLNECLQIVPRGTFHRCVALVMSNLRHRAQPRPLER